jgi:hypothetical protein
VESPVRQQVQFRVGSNDSATVFLNGHAILNKNVERLAKLDDDVVDVELKQGPNLVLVKVGQTQGEWGFFFRITDRQGNPIRGLTINPDDLATAGRAMQG